MIQYLPGKWKVLDFQLVQQPFIAFFKKFFDTTLKLNRRYFSRLVQLLTGHNKLKRHKNLQNKENDLCSYRLCLENEKSTFHVKAKCPATQTVRTKVFELPTPMELPDPPDWDVSQVVRFLRKSPIGDMTEQD